MLVVNVAVFIRMEFPKPNIRPCVRVNCQTCLLKLASSNPKTQHDVPRIVVRLSPIVPINGPTKIPNISVNDEQNVPIQEMVAALVVANITFR
ncbi:hypothetical protein AX774_g1525 [Zancudomyces culisetae]|uniref:Uncharacterized protein n=1 Tax=Zancudomyces culisetae TaxID=1213189 RepID=A0A1R1PVE2_ZANCU|nr:hypothetical protein AX774_g1525 [Zancudomyces culisetae]|eukprot:OMH84935.1 hypothetical protein AX774_g1525 [Zancudomyces culisetae]